MGADAFFTYGFGKDAREAFTAAREYALWESGHGGYSGTIAEKPGFVLFELPPRMTATAFDDILADLSFDDGVEPSWDQQMLARVKKQLATGGLKRDQRTALIRERDETEKRVREQRKRRAKLEKQLGPSMALVRRAARVYESKWDEAVAVKLTGKEATEARKRLGVERKRGDVFAFMGYASS